jgi:hypothetical protein
VIYHVVASDIVISSLGGLKKVLALFYKWLAITDASG